MTNIPQIDRQRYDYDLPDERIAKYPLAERDMSKLLVYNNGEISETHFRNILSYFPEGGSTIVFNNTKVIRARLHFRKATGAPIEIFCLEPVAPVDVQQAFAERSSTTWNCIVGNSKKWKEGTLERDINGITLRAERLQAERNNSIVRFTWNGNASFADVMEQAGVMPIPPYLNRETEALDTVRYQTVYSQHKGSVAAPTAGLHFTDAILDNLRAAGHQTVNLTLHVGAGTFKPIDADNIADHVMHAEHFIVERTAIENILHGKKPLTAVGTTSVRTLESLYWLGVKILQGEPSDMLLQWDAYSLPQDVSPEVALQALLDYMDARGDDHFNALTQIMIVPGYKFRLVDRLITNFHQPHSTLLLLIGAFVGDDWHKIYDYALTHDFRFLSYGDSSLLIPKKHI